MTGKPFLHRLTDIAWLNVALTNYVPRRTLTRLIGWLSRIEQPLVRDASIAVWRRFSDLDLSEAKSTQFKSLRDCFIRELKDGARPIDRREEVVTSPCDAIIGATGRIEDGALLQVKGRAYRLAELLRDDALAEAYSDGVYVTLRLTASMYHRFHAPHDGRITRVSHIWGDTWNVNPPTLARIDRVFCRNERAVLQFDLARGSQRLLLVPVAAILVAGLHFHFADLPQDRAHTAPWARDCDAEVRKGEELGWFEHGSTIIVLASADAVPSEVCREGAMIRMGEALLRLP